MIKNIKERVVGISGSASGVASILGSWQICHNLCLGLIALLGIIGITLTGMPLLFLTEIAIPLWSIAVVLLLITFTLYIKKKCISKNLLTLNSGLIIAGIPFQQVQDFSVYFWIIGGVLVITAITSFIKDKMQNKRNKK